MDVRDESLINLDKIREILEEAKKPVDAPDGQVWDSFAKKYVVDNQADVDERRLELDQREAKKYICDFGRHCGKPLCQIPPGYIKECKEISLAGYCVNEGRLTRNIHKLKSNRERIAETIRNLERYVTYHTFHRLTGYKLPKNRVKNTGRLFAYPSVQSLPSSVRNQVLDERYMDFDIDACHPTCLIALRARGFKPPRVLIDYVENISEWRKTLAAYYETTADNVKERINAAMNSQNLEELVHR